MKREVYAQETEFLAGYPSEIELRDQNRYSALDRDGAVRLCRMKDKTIVLFDKRYRAAREVIDVIAKRIGIDPDDTSFWLYTTDLDGSSPIVAKMDEYFSRSGDKAKLKKRIDELERENQVLRSLITGRKV